jgi:hypothetical protein
VTAAWWQWGGRVQVSRGDLAAELIVAEGRVTEAPPVLGWTVGSDIPVVAKRLRRAGFTVQVPADVA